jgi:hypothetical protein
MCFWAVTDIIAYTGRYFNTQMKKGITLQAEPTENVLEQAPAYKAALYGAAGGRNCQNA